MALAIVEPEVVIVAGGIMPGAWRDAFNAVYGAWPDLLGGFAGEFDFRIESILLKSGAVIPLQRSGVTAIVGANNAGKSTLLRETWQKLGHQSGWPTQETISVEEVRFGKSGTGADVITWLGDNSTFVAPNPRNGIQSGFQRSQMGILDPHSLTSTWSQSISSIGTLQGAIGFYGNAEGRFGMSGSTEMRDSSGDPPAHPVHYLQDSAELLSALNDITDRIFGLRLSLDTLARTIRLRVGEVAMEPPRIDQISAEYRAAMSELRPLDEQGDGMRSLLGQLLPVITSAYKYVMLDEPEAFLHPPQAHALGRELGRISTETGLQIITATHDRNFLTGLLESGVDVSVVRLNRTGADVRASQLDSDQLRDLWSDPVLKYTNVLDGLFHRLVVAAEAEGDCAYLAAAVDSLPESDGGLPNNEILFVPTGGKAGMAKVCSALSAVNVPIVAAPDLDMIAAEADLRNLAISMGHTWTAEMSDLWKKCTADLRAPRGEVKVKHVVAAVSATLSGREEETYSREHKDIVMAQMRATSSPWAAVKQSGIASFSGDARVAIGQLLIVLDEIGIVLVNEGELERLAPEVPVRKGPGWLQAALAGGHQSNESTRKHIKRILKAGTTTA